MDKIYITKSKLQELLTSYSELNEEYPKPLLTLIAIMLTVIVVILLCLLMAIFVISVIIYMLVFWVDILVGKYIIKRIYKR